MSLVSIMVANNETGVVQPIRELASAAHTVGAVFHTDAIQGYLHIPLDVTELGVDAMSVAAHKLAVLWHPARSTLDPHATAPPHLWRRTGSRTSRRHAGPAHAASLCRCCPHASAPMLRSAKSCKPFPTNSTPRLRPIHAFMPPWATTSRSTVCRVWFRSTLTAWTPRSSSSSSMPPALKFRPDRLARAAAWTSTSLSAMGIGREQALGALRISFDDRVNPSDLDDFAQTLLSIVGGA